MAEYIEREVALKKLCEGCCEYDSEDTTCDCNERLAILKIPAADVVPVVHGRWEKKAAYNDGVINVVACSACKTYQPTGCWDYHKYCPYCGARMDGA